MIGRKPPIERIDWLFMANRFLQLFSHDIFDAEFLKEWKTGYNQQPVQ
jgi:hypothetical protein